MRKIGSAIIYVIMLIGVENERNKLFVMLDVQRMVADSIYLINKRKARCLLCW